MGRQWGAVCTGLALALSARQMPLAEFGRLTFYLALFSFLESFVDFGTGAVTLQKGGTDDARFLAHLRAARRSRGLVACVGALLVALGVSVSGEPDALLLSLAAAYPLTRTLETSSLVFQRRITHGLPVLVRGVGATARLVGIALVFAAGVRTAGPVLLVHATAVAATNVGLHVAARRSSPLLHRESTGARPAVGALLRTAFPLALAGLAQQAYFYADNLFVRGMLGTEELGRYNAAARLFSWLVLVAAHATTVALPWLVREHENGRLASAALRLTVPLGIGGVATALVLHATAEPLLGIVFGASFASSASALRWLLAAAACVFCGASFLTALIAAGRNWTAAGVTGAALVVNAVGNLLLIPRLGIEGAAAATLASEALVLVLSLLLVSRRL